MPDSDQPVGIPKSKRPQQYTIHHTEDGGVCANSQRKRKYGDNGETRTFEHLPQSVTKILKHSFHKLLN